MGILGKALLRDDEDDWEETGMRRARERKELGRLRDGEESIP